MGIKTRASKQRRGATPATSAKRTSTKKKKAKSIVTQLKARSPHDPADFEFSLNLDPELLQLISNTNIDKLKGKKTVAKYLKAFLNDVRKTYRLCHDTETGLRLPLERRPKTDYPLSDAMLDQLENQFVPVTSRGVLHFHRMLRAAETFLRAEEYVDVDVDTCRDRARVRTITAELLLAMRDQGKKKLYTWVKGQEEEYRKLLDQRVPQKETSPEWVNKLLPIRVLFRPMGPLRKKLDALALAVLDGSGTANEDDSLQP